MFFEQLQKLCNSNNISLTALVEDKLHMSRSNVTKWKDGKVPKIDTIQKISSYFNVSADYLLGNEQKNKPLVNNDEELTEYLQQLKTRPEMKMLFNLAKGATKEDVEKAVKIVEAFLKKD